MDTACIQCHTEFPILTEFGRQFKLSGFTMSQTSSDLPPIAVMLQPSFTHTAKGQAGGAAPGFGANNNFALSQASIFYAGRLFGPYADHLLGPQAAEILDKFGLFFQTTYDGGARHWSWDNAELRFADTGTWAGKPLVYGTYLNNNPTMQDPWNTLPAWGFPFSFSKLAPTPAAATLIDGGLSQETAGLGGYAFWNGSLYLDFGAYRTLGARFQNEVGVDASGETPISGLAPYWRAAWERTAGGGTWEVGTFGLSARTFPGPDHSTGTDARTDFGFDSEYQWPAGRHDAVALVSYIQEIASRDASRAQDLASAASGHLSTFRATTGDLYDKTLGLTVQYFVTQGAPDSLLYPGNRTGSPGSDGFIFQFDFLPINKNGGPRSWPRSNMKISVQYTLYRRFDGSNSDFAGTGRNAADNNTLYLETWIDF